MPCRSILAACLTVTAAGCFRAAGPVDDSGADAPSDPCDALAGTAWQSVEEEECGLGPDGPVLCRWSIRFDADGSFSWHHSDVAESGTWTCEDGVITGQADGGRSYSGEVDEPGDALVWEGLDYEPAPAR